MTKSLKIIRFVLLAGIFIAPLTPLIVTKFLFFPFITGKNFFFRIVVEIIASLWLIMAVYDKRYRPKKSWILYFFSVFVAVLVLATIFGANPYRSFWSNFERMEGLITYLHLFAYFLILSISLNKEKLWKIFFNISLGVSFFVAIYGLLQLTGTLAIHQSDVRLDATLGNASYLAIYMVFHIFIALWLFLKDRNWYRWFYIPVTVLETVILYYTATRGAILGFVGGLFLSLLIISLFSESKKIKIAAVSFIGAIVLFAGVFFLVKDSDFVRHSPVLSRFSSISMSDLGTQSRFVVWKISWEGFKEKPIFGWGPENYNLVFNKYYEPVLWAQEPWFDRAHNVFFDKLTTSGILGLLAYLGLFGAPLFYILLRRKKYGFSVYDSGILTGMFAAYFFHNIFVFDNIVSSIVFCSFLAYIHFRTIDSGQFLRDEKIFSSPDDYKKPALVSFITIAGVFVIYSANVSGILSANSLLSGIMHKEVGFNNPEVAEQEFKASLDYFKKSIAYDSFGTPEAREHLANFSSRLFDFTQASDEIKMKVFDAASSEMKKQIEESPDDIRYLLFGSSLYNEAKMYDEAIVLLKKAVELSPRKQQIYFELATSYINKKDYENCVPILKTAFDLDPAYDEARVIYAMALIMSGRESEGENLLKEKYGTEILVDERLIRAYIERGDYHKVAAILEKLVEQSPDNAQYQLRLGASYLQIGQREKAIAQIQKVIELEPNFKEQGEYYINEIRAGRNP